MSKEAMIVTNKDLIVALSKVDMPSKQAKQDIHEYVCLGHFDRAVIKEVNPDYVSASFRGFNRIAFDRRNAYEEIINKSENPEGLQQNYLINSGKTLGTPLSNPPFTFMMTISVSRSEGIDSLDKCIQYFKKMKYDTNIELNKSFFWRFYYPVARGDIILMLDSNSFAAATEALYSFVLDNEVILYSFTIPMISSKWLLPNSSPNAEESLLCSLRLRATVRNYKKLYKLINDIGIKNGQGSPTLSASFGTDDVIVDFGNFSEEKMHQYLSFILDEDRHKMLDEAVFSSELDVPRIVKSGEITGEKN